MVPFATIFALSMVRASCTIPRYSSWTLRGNAMVVEFIQSCAFLFGVPMNRARFREFPFSRPFAKECFGSSFEIGMERSGDGSLVRNCRDASSRSSTAVPCCKIRSVPEYYEALIVRSQFGNDRHDTAYSAPDGEVNRAQ